MNGNVKKIFDEIEPPDDLHEAVGAGLQRKRSVKKIMSKTYSAWEKVEEKRRPS